MALIAVDIDNTLYSFEDAARQAYLDLADERANKDLFKGAYNPWGEWRSMMDSAGHEAGAAVIEKVHTPEVISRQRPFQGCREVLRALVDDGHELLYISNRSPDAYEVTAEWLIDFNFPFHEKLETLICTLEDKIPYVSRCQYIIDDRPKTLVQFVYNYEWTQGIRRARVERRRLGFGLAFPFNQNLTDVPGIYLAPTWGGISYYLKEKGVLSG